MSDVENEENLIQLGDQEESDVEDGKLINFSSIIQKN